MKDLRVYVIQLDQPFENWFGELKSYYPSSDFCEVENNEGEVIKVRCSEVLDAESMKPIKQILL